MKNLKPFASVKESPYGDYFLHCVVLGELVFKKPEARGKKQEKNKHQTSTS